MGTVRAAKKARRRNRQKTKANQTRKAKKVLGKDKPLARRNHPKKNNTQKKKVQTAADKAKSQLKKIDISVVKVSPFTRTVSLQSLYRNVNANVQYLIRNISPTAIGNIASHPAKNPAGLAYYLYWCFVEAVRQNGNPVDDIPDIGTLPSFGRRWNVPVAFLTFLQGYLRNKTKTIDVSAKFGDLTTLFSGAVTAGITYNATNSQYSSSYGALYSPASTGNGIEWQYPVSVATATQAQLISEGDFYSDLVGKASGSMPFESLLDPSGRGISGYNSPILCAFPTTAGFSSAYPFDREMAYMVTDVATSVTGRGPVLEPYPGDDQDLFVLNAVNILNHTTPPTVSMFGGKVYKFPRNVHRILNPGRGNHQWHGLGKIRSLVVNQTRDASNWIGLQRLINAVCQCVYGSAPIGATTNMNVLNAQKVVDLCLQAYALCHAMDWGWTKYCVPNGLDTSIYVNSITCVGQSSFKDLNVPSVILDWVREQAYPILIAGKVTLPSMPTICRSALANWAGLQAAYANQSSVTWATVAAPNGYGVPYDLKGLYTTSLYNSAGLTTPQSWFIGPTLQFALTAANAFGAITATNQSPAVPIRLSKQFLLTYDMWFVNANLTISGTQATQIINPLALFSLNFPRKGGVGYHFAVTAFQQQYDQDNGWTNIEWDFVDIQTAVGIDRASFWRGADAPKIFQILSAIGDRGELIYPFRTSVVSPDTGLTEMITGMRKDNGGLQYQSILTGIEAADKTGSMPFKNLVALDHVTTQINSNRDGPTFVKADGLNAARMFLLAQKDIKSDNSSIGYSGKGQGDGMMFAPNSMTGLLSFLQGVSGALHTGIFVAGKIAGWLDSVLGIGKVSAV